MHRAKKHLGQHFLTSKKIVADIVGAARLEPRDTVLEIGPGRGILTRELLTYAERVIAIEKDSELVTLLEETFSKEISTDRLNIIEEDVRTVFFDETVSLPETYIVVANIPYYITGEIIELLLSAQHQPNRVVLLVQKEVAERVVARDGKESVLSIAVKAYGKPHIARKVSRKFFSPQPNVDSAVLVIEDITRTRFVDIKEENFFALVKKGFAHKRKKLASNLDGLVAKDTFASFVKERGLPEAARAEELSVDAWFALVRKTMN